MRQQSVILLVLLFEPLAIARVDAQLAKPRPTTGPSAASLATPYSGPLKFNPRVLAQERSASYDPDPITRAASWRYRYSAPAGYYSGYYGYGGYRPYFGYSRGSLGRGYGYAFGGLGWWGPY